MRVDGPSFEVVRDRAALDSLNHLPRGCFEHAEWVRAVSVARGRRHKFIAVKALRPQGPPAYLFGAVHRRFGIAIFESMPMGGYGGWVCEEALGVEDERELTLWWLRQSPCWVVSMISKPNREAVLPEFLVPPRLGRLRRLTRARELETHLLDLTADDATLLQRTRTRVRSYLRKVDHDKAGIDIEHGAQLEEFLALYRRGRLAWKQQPAGHLTDEFFLALAQSGYMDVWIASQNGQPVSAAVFLLGRHEVQYQASGSERVSTPVPAMDALIWTAAKHYRDRGFQVMNMGASEGLDSVRRFKEKFGASAGSYRRILYIFPQLMSRLFKAA